MNWSPIIHLVALFTALLMATLCFIMIYRPDWLVRKGVELTEKQKADSKKAARWMLIILVLTFPFYV